MCCCSQPAASGRRAQLMCLALLLALACEPRMAAAQRWRINPGAPGGGDPPAAETPPPPEPEPVAVGHDRRGRTDPPSPEPGELLRGAAAAHDDGAGIGQAQCKGCLVRLFSARPWGGGGLLKSALPSYAPPPGPAPTTPLCPSSAANRPDARASWPDARGRGPDARGSHPGARARASSCPVARSHAAASVRSDRTPARR